VSDAPPGTALPQMTPVGMHVDIPCLARVWASSAVEMTWLAPSHEVTPPTLRDASHLLRTNSHGTSHQYPHPLY